MGITLFFLLLYDTCFHLVKALSVNVVGGNDGHERLGINLLDGLHQNRKFRTAEHNHKHPAVFLRVPANGLQGRHSPFHILIDIVSYLFKFIGEDDDLHSGLLTQHNEIQHICAHAHSDVAVDNVREAVAGDEDKEGDDHEIGKKIKTADGDGPELVHD